MTKRVAKMSRRERRSGRVRTATRSAEGLFISFRTMRLIITVFLWSLRWMVLHLATTLMEQKEGTQRTDPLSLCMENCRIFVVAVLPVTLTAAIAPAKMAISCTK